LGFRILFKFLFRRLSLNDLLGVARRALQIQSCPVILPFAESGMDVDKPHQLEQVEAYLRQRASRENDKMTR
jgi:hypothetical protein